MTTPATNTASTGVAKTNALKTFAVNFIIAFAGYWTYKGAKSWYDNYQAKTIKP